MSADNSSLCGKYCIARGSQSASGSKYNGKECYVWKPSPDVEGRFQVLFIDDDRKFVSLKADNLELLTHVAVRPATVEVVEDGGKKTTKSIGKGLFATRAFKKGELIFAERPLAVVHDQVYDMG